MVNPFQKVRIFGQETMRELRKADWPTWRELRESTVVVLIAAAILGFAIFLGDWSIFNWISWLSDVVS